MKDPDHISEGKTRKFNAIIEDIDNIGDREPLKISDDQILHSLKKAETTGVSIFGAVLSLIKLAAVSVVKIRTDSLKSNLAL